jgi:hypothetical protein
MAIKQTRLRPKELKGVGRVELLESSGPCCLPNCCNNNSGNK